ncbi:hypothetical protein CXB51_021854 [Gossypium anomalum]|uniref:Uncharacterized protein ycf68 n=1 Tax=Gossypium anomalum TaxID=47600 RepID=A0A8J5YA53_9ROSI|nr:hypothetical protein CXB51_021854 [Gossypium anomalum]
MDSSMCSSAPNPEMWIIQGTLAWRTSPGDLGEIQCRSSFLFTRGISAVRGDHHCFSLLDNPVRPQWENKMEHLTTYLYRPKITRSPLSFWKNEGIVYQTQKHALVTLTVWASVNMVVFVTCKLKNVVACRCRSSYHLTLQQWWMLCSDDGNCKGLPTSLELIYFCYTSFKYRVSNSEACTRDIDCLGQCKHGGFCDLKTKKCSCLPVSEQLPSNIAATHGVLFLFELVFETKLLLRRIDEAVQIQLSIHSWDLGVYGQLSLERRFRFGLNKKNKMEHLTTVTEGLYHSSFFFHAFPGGPEKAAINKIFLFLPSQKEEREILFPFRRDQEIGSSHNKNAWLINNSFLGLRPPHVSNSEACTRDIDCFGQCKHGGFCDLITKKCSCLSVSEQLPSNIATMVDAMQQ